MYKPYKTVFAATTARPILPQGNFSVSISTALSKPLLKFLFGRPLAKKLPPRDAAL